MRIIIIKFYQKQIDLLTSNYTRICEILLRLSIFKTLRESKSKETPFIIQTFMAILILISTPFLKIALIIHAY